MGAADTNRLVDAIGRAAATLPEVQGAFLFGSHATGRARADSDIDVAVLLEDALAPSDAHQRLRRVIGALAAEIAADRLDVVIPNGAPPALAFQVLKHGRLAYERDPTAVHRFRVRTYSLHADFEPVEKFFRAVTRRRVLGESHGG